MNRCGPPICVPCAVEMECEKNEFIVADPEPATYWSGDLYRCPGCGCRVVTGFGAPFEDASLLPESGVSLHFVHSLEHASSENEDGG